MLKTIVVQKEGQQFVARIKGSEHKNFTAGTNVEAIGGLMRNHADHFDIRLIEPVPDHHVQHDDGEIDTL